MFKILGRKDTDGELKIVCDIVRDHDLNVDTKSLKSLIISNDITKEQKISLLKIKLDFIINGECAGKKRFLVMLILGSVLTFTISGGGADNRSIIPSFSFLKNLQGVV